MAVRHSCEFEECDNFHIFIFHLKFTSLSLLLRIPRTKSVRFLSNIRSKFPLTFFSAMILSLFFFLLSLSEFACVSCTSTSHIHLFLVFSCRSTFSLTERGAIPWKYINENWFERKWESNAAKINWTNEKREKWTSVLSFWLVCSKYASTLRFTCAMQNCQIVNNRRNFVCHN